MKLFKKLRICFFGILLSTVSFAQNFSPDIVVDINGTGDFTSLQAAFDAAPAGIATLIYVKRGLYDKEKLIIPANKTKITLIGESRTETIISYDVFNCNDGGDGMCPDNKVALWASNTELMKTSATLTVQANDFRAENLTIQNTAGPVGQALAVVLQSDRNVFVNCDLLGYQDTLYFWAGESARSYFKTCVIEGRTDFIYGNGVGFFDQCEIRSFGGGYITAPSTTINQKYGFVFYKCDLTYKTNSPRLGDDGMLIRLGRPWHEYPKVAWLYCNMTDKINPLGWGDKWSMSYSDTSTDLHLYEWMNTGAGADMSGRANWAGLRSMTDQNEANLYEAKIVLAGTDNWDPTAIAPAVTVFNWDGGATNTGWLEANNWNPNAVPVASEAANVDGNIVIDANGGSFAADLNLVNGATIDVSANSTATLLTVSESTISSAASGMSLSGTIKTKGALYINTSGNLIINSSISGVHPIAKMGTGICQLNSDNSGISGDVVIQEGDLQAKVKSALGISKKITVKSSGKLTVDVSNAVDVKTALYTEGTTSLVLNQDITISEWYIDGVIQPIGEYNSTTNPSTISGSGKIIIGRPSEFIFIGGTANGNWDNPAHYSPALLPLAGEKVIVDGLSIEAQTSFAGDMYVQNGGSIRLRRQDSKCLEPVRMFQNTNISYATSGAGMYLNAPIILEGDISLLLNSGNANGNTMDLPGTFSGAYKVAVRNSNSSAATTASVKLGGDNSNFTGTWDLTVAPTNAGAAAAINGNAENAFGKGIISLAANNKALFNHIKCAGDELNMNITGTGTASAVLNVAVVVKKFTLNGTQLADGKYDSTTHPGLLSGAGSITVNSASLSLEEKVFLVNGSLSVIGNLESLEIFNILGQRLYQTKSAKEIDLKEMKTGVYIVRYKIDGKQGSTKVYKD